MAKQPAGQPSVAPANAWWVLAGLWLLYASFGAVATSLAPIVAPVEADLGMSHVAMGSVMGAWQLVYIFSAIPCGMLLDRIGGKRALVLGIGLIAASALGRAFAVDYWTLLLAVMLFGLGGPIVSSGAPKLVAQLFTGSRRGLAMGIYMTGPALGSVVSLAGTHTVLLPAFGGEWRSVMAFWAAACVVALIVWWLIATRFLPPADASPGEDVQDGAGQLAQMLDLLRHPAVPITLLLAVGVFLYNHGLNNWLPELLRHGGMSATAAGYWATVPTIVGVAGSLLIPRLATPARRFYILSALAAAALGASLLLQAAAEPALLFTGLVLQGIARSSLMTILVLILVELPAVGERRAGLASGMFFAAAEIGGVLGPVGLGLSYDSTGSFVAALYGLSAVSVGLLVGCVLLARQARPQPAASSTKVS